MYYENFFIAALGLSSYLIAGEVSADRIPNIKILPTPYLTSFSSFFPSHSLLSTSSQIISQSPSPNPTTTPTTGLSAERGACKRIPQVGKAQLCEGQVLAKYKRREEARDLLIMARDTFLANGKPNEAENVEKWARENGIVLVAPTTAR